MNRHAVLSCKQSLAANRSFCPSGKAARGWALAALLFCLAQAAAFAGDTRGFPRATDSYYDQGRGVFAQLAHRVAVEPFNAVAAVIFLCAITHTFLASRFTARSHHYEQALARVGGDDRRFPADGLQFRARLFHFLGEIEAIFGIWLIPLAAGIIVFHGWGALVSYAEGTSFADPIFVAAVMGIASSRPVLLFAEACLARVASLGGATPAAWWFSILTVGPLLGSVITQPAAMTICALLLSRRFYALQPGPALRYATLGLLFVDISVGGTLTNFAAPPVVIVASKWNWGLAYMFTQFGWKAVVGILVANGAHYAFFRGELRRMRPTAPENVERAFPATAPVTIVHLLFIVWTVVNAHHSALVVLGFLFFLAFADATERRQHPLRLRGPLLVGFFLASLLLHGGCQAWWIAPVLGGLTRWPLMIGATLLTAVNDNAAITYLATLVPGFSEKLKFAVVAGAMTGGGLTIIANAPNPAGQSILRWSFGEEGISPAKLFLAALTPTLIMGAAFMLLP